MKNCSEKKLALIKELEKTPFKVMDYIYVRNSVFGQSRNPEQFSMATVIEIPLQREDELTIINEAVRKGDNFSRYIKKTIKISETEIKRYVYEVGADPFDKSNDKVRAVAFTMESILFNLNVLNEKTEDGFKYKTKKGSPIYDCNWNPVAITNNEVKTYQRDFVWTTEQKQLLIESIYNGIACGSILVRKRSWEELDLLESLGVENLAFTDIVDGKQRLNALKGFIMNEFPDRLGNYYDDLSIRAQRKVTNHQLITYSEIQENTSDEVVLKQFLKMNFMGTPQSKEHLDYVASLLTIGK